MPAGIAGLDGTWPGLPAGLSIRRVERNRYAQRLGVSDNMSLTGAHTDRSVDSGLKSSCPDDTRDTADTTDTDSSPCPVSQSIECHLTFWAGPPLIQVARLCYVSWNEDLMADIRVRFAPSPTGYLHVGGARTALYNWLFARHHGGVFILRIEDTDVDRSKPELETAILESMRWLGLTWDEGPEVGGACGPYRQSERQARYREVVVQLEQSGAAYPCFCTAEELAARRARAEAEHRAWKYDGACRNLSADEAARRRSAGQPFALRFRVPDSGATPFDDQVYGRIEVVNTDIEDFVLARSDGHPTYHLGVVADDLDMRVTDVIRGADHLSNTPKQILMYRALGAAVPRFAHLPLILGPDKQRLSKRHGATAVGAYQEQGVLPAALVNFLALLGWTPPGGKEIVPLEEMVDTFELRSVSKSNAVFDLEKLAWMNAEYLRHLPRERLLPLVEEELRKEGFRIQDSEFRLERSALLLQTRARSLKDFVQSGRAFFSDDFDYDPGARKKFWKDAALAEYLDALASRLEAVEPFSVQETEKSLRALADEKEIKAGLLINASRVALTGQGVAPGLFEVMAVLGRARVVSRLRRAGEFIRNANASNG
jgi:glutamyl-tRNA synthetase